MRAVTMSRTSRTGLLASKTKKIIRVKTPQPVQFKVVAKSAPYMLKPFAGLYNPYPYGCSLLCNHPTDNEARELLKRAKDTWASEGKNLLLCEEVEAIRATLDELHIKMDKFGGHIAVFNDGDNLPIESIPEELFRRYTETDSRPLTPAPTLMSAHTRASGSRRCVTPEPVLTAEVREKTQLILDLRRSHSQETLSWYGSAHYQQEMPPITIFKAPTDTRSSPRPLEPCRKRSARSGKTPSPAKISKADHRTYLEVTPAHEDSDSKEDVEEEEDEIVKRRGRRRRKRGRDFSRDPPPFHSSIDPETQVATIDPESHNPSARPSLVPNDPLTSASLPGSANWPNQGTRPYSFSEVDSYLDVEILKLLRRELDEEVIDREFDFKRRKALEEAIKTVQPNQIECDELKKLKRDLLPLTTNENLKLNVPRMFSRADARFELPMDSREFNDLKPLEYVEKYVHISSSRKQLYNYIFNKYKDESDIENEHRRLISGKHLLTALNEMMGKKMTESQSSNFHALVGWTDDNLLDFKAFCGLCALCERLLAPEYYKQLPDRKMDPCHEIETVDFRSLPRKLNGQDPDQRLVKILYAIKES